MKSSRKRLVCLFAIFSLMFSVALCPGAPTDTAEAKPAVVAHFHLSGMLSESPVVDPFGFTAGEITSLSDLVGRMSEAGADDQVKAIVLTFDNLAMGLGQLEELRTAIDGFKATGKKVYVHTGSMSTFVYGLLSAGSYLSVEPQSMVWLTGIYGESLYIKD